MNSITISKKIIKNDDLILVSRREYESLLKLKKIKEFAPTLAQKMALKKAEQNLKQKKTLSYNELVHELGFAN